MLCFHKISTNQVYDLFQLCALLFANSAKNPTLIMYFSKKKERKYEEFLNIIWNNNNIHPFSHKCK